MSNSAEQTAADCFSLIPRQLAVRLPESLLGDASGLDAPCRTATQCSVCSLCLLVDIC